MNLQQGLQPATDRFSDACDHAGTKISTEKFELLCLSRRPRRCILQVRGSTLLQVEVFKYIWDWGFFSVSHFGQNV